MGGERVAEVHVMEDLAAEWVSPMSVRQLHAAFAHVAKVLRGEQAPGPAVYYSLRDGPRAALAQ